MRAIVGLAAAYVLIVAVVLFYTSDAGSKADGVLFGEAFFAAPMMIAYALARWMIGVEARRVILGFEVGFSVLTLAIFYLTFSGEHDAQYQLALLLIPLFGFPSVVVAGLIAARLR